jgi:DnaJ homolog subfamily A member 5
VTVLSFSWVDKYNTTEAPNRLVKRAMEKENRKLRDAAKKKYIETVRELATYVRRRDPRIVKIESEKKKREEEEALKRIQFKSVSPLECWID